MNAPTTNIIHLELGDVCCAVRCNDDYLSGHLIELQRGFVSQRRPDITIELEAVDGKSPAEVKAALCRTRISRDGSQFMADELILGGEFDAVKSLISLRVERSLFDPGAEFKLMNRILTVAYYSACQMKFGGSPPALLVHSSGIARGGHALLFTGPCESGKTTIARFCDDGQGRVLNDEMVMVSRPGPDNRIITARGIPIIGGIPRRSNIEAPLKCVLTLKQSKRTVFHRLSRMEAYLRFMRQVISPAHFGQTDRAAYWSLIADFTDEVTGTIPFYELEFTLDKDQLWSVIAELERTLEKEEISATKPAN